ncbi:MAG TPA: hypothetical protein DF712_21945 [Balneola sp.]|nr:hypothetical protein [Balneola sp.]|tara:strand:- start:717 stop:1157 length:441 start_codon:yes stop_codon:yes gene_type:complete
MIASLLTPEFLSLIGGSLTGFVFKYLTETREMRREQFEMFMQNKQADREDQDAAIKRVGQEAGKIVRRTIVVAVLFGTIIAPFVLPFFGIPTVVEIKTTTEPFLGIFGGGQYVQFHNVYGYLFTEENRQILLSIVGFYFGSATARK